MNGAPSLPYVPTVPVVIRRAAAEFGDTDFVVMPDRRVTFRDAEAASRRLAKQLLAAGVGKGTRIGIHFPTGPEWAISWLAAARIGALTMPFSTIYRPAELRTALRLGDVDLLMAPARLLGKDHEAFLEEAVPGLTEHDGQPLRVPEIPYLRSVWVHAGTGRHWAHELELSSDDVGGDGVDDRLLFEVEAEVTPADLLVAIFTSGTTAAPKAVVHTHGAVLRKTATESAAGLDASFPGRVLSFMPFFWVGGLQSLTGALQSGATVLTLERLDHLEALDLAVRERATSIQGNPTVMQALLAARGGAAETLESLRPLPPRTWERDANIRGDTRNALGMTETMGVWASVPGFEHQVVSPETGTEVPAGETGEFRVRGYGLMHGLYKREREDVFTQDGFYRTGDIGHVEDGYICFESRLGDMIKTKGANVAPAEVETVLRDTTGVRLAFVVGLPHHEFGQEVAAALVPVEGAELDLAAVLDEARRVLSSYKVPTFVEVLAEDDVRWLPSGKADVRSIAALLSERRRMGGTS